MRTIKEAWKLVKTEHKMTPPSYLLVLLLLVGAVFFMVMTFTEQEMQATIGTEAIFILIVIGFPYMIRSKHLQPQNIGLKVHTSPKVVLLQTMPISKQTIATYRMLSYTGITLMYNTIFFSLFYAFSPYMRSIASPGTYIVFAIMWICFAIYAGGFQVNMEAGYHLLTYSFFMILIWLPIFMIASIFLFYNIYSNGLIQWMLDVSEAYPFIVSGVSMTLAIVGYFIHKRGFIKRMERTDY